MSAYIKMITMFYYFKNQIFFTKEYYNLLIFFFICKLKLLSSTHMNDEDVLYFYRVQYLVSDRLTVWSNLIPLFMVEYIKKIFYIKYFLFYWLWWLIITSPAKARVVIFAFLFSWRKDMAFSLTWVSNFQWIEPKIFQLDVRRRIIEL